MAGSWDSDTQFREVELDRVRKLDDGGWDAKGVDGWSFYIPASEAKPQVGSIARIYGKGIGYAFRGIVIDGVKVFYRTEREDEEHRECEIYGADPADYLARWDAGESVWSVERGGFGPGYEQALQLAMFEVLRHLICSAPKASDWEKDADTYCAVVDAAQDAVTPIVRTLGLSGAQWGAAMALAARIYRDGPRKVLKAAPDDRKIQVSRDFPSLPVPADSRKAA